jgi:large subunit ribosomal protein L15
MVTLSKLRNSHLVRFQSKRVGRGVGSGLGKTCGRGTKGDKSRSGYKKRHGQEGGQLPVFRKIPIRGFSRGRFREDEFTINLKWIERYFEDGATVNLASLQEKHLIAKKKNPKIKVLGVGDISKKLSFEVHAVSASAKEKIDNAKGQIKYLV